MSTKVLENVSVLRDKLSLEFFNGIKTASEFKIGTEIEKINVNKDDFHATPYVVLEKFLNTFSSRCNWEKISEDNCTIGLIKNGHSISLEPGSQLEISLAPMDNIHQIFEFLTSINAEISSLAESMGFYTLGYGIQPLSTYEDIKIIPKKRYAAMTDYFEDKGDMAYIMMRETAGIQVNLDYSSEKDAISKLRLGMILAPIISSIFANSPIRGGKNTGYKSFRAKSWLYTDDDRCGFVSEKLLNPNYNFSFEDYVEILLALPMIFVQRGEKAISVNSTFRDYLKNGYNGLYPTMADWELHKNLYFPEVRLKSFLEFRNADSQNMPMSLALIALYKGIFYDDEAIKKTYSLLYGIDYKHLIKMRYISPMCGIETNIGNTNILNFATDLFSIAEESLQKQSKTNNKNNDESIYLSELKKYINSGESPSDRVLRLCGSDVSQIVNYTRI